MKIGIDGNSLTREFQHGTRRYTEELLKNLAKIDTNNKYVIFAAKKVSIPKKKNFVLRIIPKYPILKRQFFLPRMIAKEKIDVFHNIDPYGPIFLKKPVMVTTVHDLNLAVVYPTFRSFRYFAKRLYSEITRYFVFTNTDKFIAVSKSTRSELAGFIAGERLKRDCRVIYEAPSKIFFLGNKNNQKQKYFLCMADFSPRKNIHAVFDAFLKLPDNLQTQYKLYVIVSTYSEGLVIKKVTSELGLLDKTVFFISPSDKKIVGLYRSATAFLYPSLYEGFGLPVLEAMAAGTLVITSNRGSTREVAGKAAIFVDPKSPSQLSMAMLTAIKNKPKIREIISRGYKRAKQFSWSEIAKRTLSVYQSALGHT
jgi:glycosyltransferase involved in cell wall biosynthesis